MPLLEIVTEPDINSALEAHEYLTRLKSILKYLEVSDCDMEKGSLRCDANISLRKKGRKELGAKVELKNMNTFRGVKAALEYEEKRQASLLEDGEKVAQETRLWDPEKAVTATMRYKEEAQDYRYFPEPDLVPFVPDRALLDMIKAELPQLPDSRLKRFLSQYKLSEYDAGVLIAEKDVADYFEECVKDCANPKAAANWITGDIMARLNEKNIPIRDSGLSPAALAGLLKMIDEGAISGKMAKDILIEAMETKRPPAEIVKQKGLVQISDKAELERIVAGIMEREAKSVSDYKSGKKNALAFLVGQVMRETKGKANPAMVNEMLKKRLEGSIP